MRPQDLFLEAAKEVQPLAYVTYEERDRLDLLRGELNNRAASLFDFVFDRWGEDMEGNPVLVEDPNLKAYFGQDATNAKMAGECRVSIVEDLRDKRYDKELTVRWMGLESQVSGEFDQFAPEGFSVWQSVLVGVHDLRFRSDEHGSWGTRRPALSIEAITKLSIKPVDNFGWDMLESGEILDPFEYGPVILERCNNEHPVFWDPDTIPFIGISKIPEPTKYSTSYALIEAINCSLDELERFYGTNKQIAGFATQA